MIRYAPALTAAAILAGTLIAPPATAAAPRACPEYPQSSTGTAGRFVAEGVHIRNGPGPECHSDGLGYTSHAISLRCNRVGSDGQWWTHLFDHTTDVTGWVRTDLLSNSAIENCS